MSETTTAGTATGDRFTSVEALRGVHRELLRRHREGSAAPGFAVEVERFLRRGQATGTVLDGERDRREAQSILDYWTTILSRGGSRLIEAELAEFDPEQAPDLADDQCPYLGLNAFQQDNREKFFGRERLIEEMVRLLADLRLLVVTGPSGCGKSSLVLAGLLPALAVGRLPGSQAWRYYRPLVPGSDPLTSLARTVRPAAEESPDWVARAVAGFRADPSHLCRLVEGSGSEPAVILVDQFEELFTLSADEPDREAFIANLVGLATSTAQAHRVVLTVRSDFESHLARFPALHPFLERQQTRVMPTPLGPADLRRAIEEPARGVGLRFADGLVGRLVKEVLGEPAALPLLQFTLLKLWEKRYHNRVTNEAYDALGGARQALARSADAFYEGLIPEEQESVRRICLRLVRPGEGLEVVRDRVRRDSLVSAIGGNAARVMDKLIEAHLLRVTRCEKPEDDQVEVVHEALVRNWPLFVRWQDEARDELRQRARLTDMAELWNARGRDPALLLRGVLLEEAGRYHDLRPLEVEFLTASRSEAERAVREKEEAERRERNVLKWRARLAVGTSVVVCVLCLGVVLLAREHQIQRERERSIKDEADELKRREKEALERLKLEKDKRKAELEKEEAERKVRRTYANRFLEAAIQFSYRNRELTLHLVRIANEADPETLGNLPPEKMRVLNRHSAPLRPRAAIRGAYPVSFIAIGFPRRKPEGNRVAVFDPNGRGSVWDTRTSSWVSLTPRSSEKTTESVGDQTQPGAAPVRKTEQTGITCAAFHRDGKRLVTGTRQGDVLFWDGSTGKPMDFACLLKLESAVTAVVLSNNNDFVGAAGQDGTAVIWKRASGEEQCRFKTENGYFSTLVAHIRGKWVATIDGQGAVQVWSTEKNDKQIFSIPIEGGDKAVDVAFDNNPPGSGRIATVTLRGKVGVWSIVGSEEGGYQVQPVFTFETGSYSAQQRIRFTADGKRVLAWNGVDNVCVWDAVRGQIVSVTPPPWRGSRTAFAFSPDGSRFAINYSTMTEPSAEAVRGCMYVGSSGMSGNLFGVLADLAFLRSKPLLAVYDLSDYPFGLRRVLESARAITSRISEEDYASILKMVEGENLVPFNKGVERAGKLDSARKAVGLLRQALDIHGLKREALQEAERLVAERLLRKAMELIAEGFRDEAARHLHLANEICRQAQVDQRAQLGLISKYRRDAESRARIGDQATAVALFQKAADLQKEAGVTQLDPKTAARRGVAAYHQRRARNFALRFKLNEAIHELEKAKDLNPKLVIDPGVEARRLVVQTRRTRAVSLANVGNVEAATVDLQRAVELDPGLTFVRPKEQLLLSAAWAWAGPRSTVAQCSLALWVAQATITPEEEAERLAVSFYRQQAQAAANRLDIETALAFFRKAARFNPWIKPDAEVKSARLKKVEVLATGGKISEAVQFMRTVESLYQDNLDPLTWNQLCWYGTLFGKAELVAEFGDKAVKGAERLNDPRRIASYKVTRGVNRAIRERFKEAIKDFEDEIKWQEAQARPNVAHVKTRQQWVEQLRIGKDHPFTEEMLKRLRNE
jgi:tetratricopeptide (TPR) repeat protein